MAGKIYETAIQIGAKLASTFRGQTGAAATALKQLGAESKKLTALQKAAAKEAAALAKAGKDASGAVAEQKRLAAALEVTTQRMKALKDAEAARERLFGARRVDRTPLFEKVGSQARGIASDVLKLVGVGTAAGAALGALGIKALQTGDEIGDTAEKLGISAQALQELRYGAKQSGAEAGELDKALAKLAVNVGKVASAKKKGGGPSGLVGNVGEIQIFGGGAGGAKAAATDPFAHLGLSAKALAELAPEKQIALIADKIAGLKTHSEKAAVAQQIFGKGAQALLPLLNEGAKGIARLSAEGHSFGGIMSNEAVAAADQADKALKKAEAAFGGVTTTLGAALLPVITDVLGKFTRFVQDNRAKIKQWAENIATWIERKAIPAVMKIGPEIFQLAEKIGGLIEKGAKLAGGFDNLAIAVAALRFAPLAKSLADATGALITYITKTLAATAATKGLQAAQAGGGAPGAGGGGGNAAGKAGAVAAAALGGYEIGKMIDEKLNLSGKFANGLARTVDTVREGYQPGGISANLARVTKLFSENATDTGSAEGRLDRTATGISRGRSYHGPLVAFSPTYHIGKGSREEVAKQLDEAHEKAKAAALDALDAREAERKRVAYGG